MQWPLKTQRERDLEGLCEAYRTQIADLQKRPAYLEARIPQEGDQLEYYRHLSQLADNDFFKYYFAHLYRKYSEAFEVQGKELSEFYRGKLHCIGDILTDASNAATIRAGMIGKQNEV